MALGSALLKGPKRRRSLLNEVTLYLITPQGKRPTRPVDGWEPSTYHEGPPLDGRLARADFFAGR